MRVMRIPFDQFARAWPAYLKAFHAEPTWTRPIGDDDLPEPFHVEQKLVLPVQHADILIEVHR